MTNFFSYLTVAAALFIAGWSLRSLWYGYYQHFLPFICAIFKAILEVDWILLNTHSELRHIANNWADIGLLITLWSYTTYGVPVKYRVLLHKMQVRVFMPYLRRPDLIPKQPITANELLEVVQKARERLQKNAKHKDGR